MRPTGHSATLPWYGEHLASSTRPPSTCTWRRQLRGQRRLPHAVHAAHDDHRLLGTRWVLGVLDDLLPPEAEEAALALAADQGHRLGQPAPRRGDGQVRTHHLVQLHGAGDPLERARPDRLQLEMWFDEVSCGLADHHRAGLGLPLEARRHVGHRTGQGRPVDDPRGQPGDHDGARVDTDPDGGLNAVPTAQLDGRLRHPLDEPQPGLHRPPGVVLVRGGVAEARHDAVALELEHAAAQLLDGLRRHPPVQGEDILNDLRLGHLGHVGRLHDVGEDQADEGSLAPGQGALERRPLHHRPGAPVRRVDGEHVVGQLDHAIPGTGRRRGVHGRQEPIDQLRQPVFRRCGGPFRGRRHRVRLLNPPRVGRG